VNIGTNSLTVNPSTLPPGTKSLAYSQTLSATGGTGPYTYALLSGALPAGLSLNTATGAITGTPTANGLANFTVRATDGNGDAGTRAFALSIGSNSLVINPTTLPAAVQGSPYSQIVSATGGTGPYTFAIVGGALPPGLTLNTTTGLISGTATGTGTFSVTIQAQDSVGDISSRAYAAFQVRPNPATDPDVQGLVSAQAATARRFATTQVTNISGHLEELHGAFDPCLINVNFGASVYNPQTGMPTSPNANPAMPGGNLPPTCVGQGKWQIPVAFWTAGSVQFGTTSLYGSANQFTTGGLTFGVDGRINNVLVVGAAFGYGSDRTTIGTDGTVTSGRNYDAMAYVSYQPFPGYFLDAVGGFGSLNIDNQRFSSFDSSFYSGVRAGSEWFASIIATTDFRTGAMKISPYVRTDLMSASLESYAEQGAGSTALTYGGTTFNSIAAVVGLRGTYDIPTSWGLVQPTARLEFRHELDSGFNQSMFYTDLGSGQTYLLNLPDLAQNSVTAGVGLRARAGQNLSAEVEYRTTAGNNATFIQTITAILRWAF
jgi:large repetitive protein